MRSRLDPPVPHVSPKQQSFDVLHDAPAVPQDATQVSDWPQRRDEQHPDAQGEPGTPQPPPASGGGLPASGGGLPASGAQQAVLCTPQLSMQFALQPLGVQQAVLTHSWVPGHDCGQRTATPQLLLIETWHRPLHAAVSSGTQHMSLAWQ